MLQVAVQFFRHLGNVSHFKFWFFMLREVEKVGLSVTVPYN